MPYMISGTIFHIGTLNDSKLTLWVTSLPFRNDYFTCFQPKLIVVVALAGNVVFSVSANEASCLVSHRNYFKAQVYTIEQHGPIGKGLM